MQKYYETLGLSQGASQSEIKKAYFGMVRQYTPENDPEKFREIREAYECLKKAEESGPSFPMPQDPWAARFLGQIREYEKRGSLALVRDACEEAFQAFPEEMQFQYLLAVYQRKSGKTGKAVKTGEALVKKDPENKWFWRELALAYIERGFTKKAFTYIMKAFEMGCTDNDFLLTSSVACNSAGRYEEGMRLLYALVGKEKRWAREEIPEVFEAYFGLCVMGEESGKGISEALASFGEFLKAYSMYVEENLELLMKMLLLLYGMAMEDSAGAECFEPILQFIQSSCGSAESEELLSVFLENSLHDRIYQDKRFSDTIKYALSAYYDEMENDMRTFAILDTKLCMMKEREELLPQLEIIEKDYPGFYEKLGDFAQKLKSGKDLEYIKDALQKQYAALEKYMEGGRYFELYPEEKIRSCGRVVYQDEEFRPFMREDRKIGRNDPCPCGSGKKYKKCCGG